MTDEYDVVVIGGGAAGLNGALMLARSRRSVLVLDAGAPRNAPADGVHGLLARDGMSPAELLERGRAEVRGYGGHVVQGEVHSAVRDGDGDGGSGGFAVELTDGQTVRARRLLVATGLVDELPDVPGLREQWGRDVVHCPYCHGWEVRDRAIGVLATDGPMALHQALLFRQLSNDVTLFSHTAAAPTAEEAEQLAARGIRVVEGEVAAVETADDRLAGLRLGDGTLIPLGAVAVAPRMHGWAAFLEKLGLVAAENPFGDHVASEAGRTSVPGVWVAGNTTDLTAQVGAAANAGAGAGAQINAELIQEETARAVAAHRQPFSIAAEAERAAQVTRERDRAR